MAIPKPTIEWSCNLFNMCMKTVSVLDDWKNASILYRMKKIARMQKLQRIKFIIYARVCVWQNSSWQSDKEQHLGITVWFILVGSQTLCSSLINENLWTWESWLNIASLWKLFCLSYTETSLTYLSSGLIYRMDLKQTRPIRVLPWAGLAVIAPRKLLSFPGNELTLLACNFLRSLKQSLLIP